MSKSTTLTTVEAPAPTISRWSEDAQRVYFDRADTLADLKKASKSANTMRGYASDWSQFRLWAAGQGIDIPPADQLIEAIPPALVLSYMADRRHQVTSATLGRHLAAIRYWHRQARMISPTDHPDVAETLAGVVRLHRYDTDQATPIFLDQLRAMVNTYADDTIGRRNRSLLLTGWWSGMRRSELVGLDVAHLADYPEGILLKLPRSKTDQVGAGRSIPIHRRQDETLCPVTALDTWKASAAITSGAVYRCIDRWGNVSGRRLSAQAVSLVVKDAVRSIGLDPTGFSGHSLRAGWISECSKRKIPKMAIRAVTGHSSDAMVDLYGRTSELFEQSAGAYFTDV